jgi:hypothetical protein
MGFDRGKLAERAPPPQYDFERAVCRDERLNITVRVAWLMVALAYRHGYSSMAVQNMAEELDCAIEAVRRSRQKVVRFGYFTPPKHWHYYRIPHPPSEKRAAHWRRLRPDRRLDLIARVAWLLTDRTRRNGAAQLSLSMIGETARRNPPASSTGNWPGARTRSVRRRQVRRRPLDECLSAVWCTTAGAAPGDHHR